MSHEEAMRESLDADDSRLIGLIWWYDETLDRRTKEEMTRLEGAVRRLRGGRDRGQRGRVEREPVGCRSCRSPGRVCVKCWSAICP